MGTANSIELYKILSRIPETTEKEARTVANSLVHINEAATKTDLAELQAATKADLAELQAATKADLAELQAATKADLAELKASTRADLAELKTELIKWIIMSNGLVIAVIGLMLKL